MRACQPPALFNQKLKRKRGHGILLTLIFDEVFIINDSDGYAIIEHERDFFIDWQSQQLKGIIRSFCAALCNFLFLSLFLRWNIKL